MKQAGDSSNKGWRAFNEARAFARSLELSSSKQWHLYCKIKPPTKGAKPADIPANPRAAYADAGWKGFGDWLGTGYVSIEKREYRSFKDARAFARGLGLGTSRAWQAFSKGNMPEKGALPADVPRRPDHIYADQGWSSMGDWLGTGAVAASLRQFRPFKQARSFAQGLGLKSEAEWRLFCKGELPGKGSRPTDIPNFESFAPPTPLHP